MPDHCVLHGFVPALRTIETYTLSSRYFLIRPHVIRTIWVMVQNGLYFIRLTTEILKGFSAARRKSNNEKTGGELRVINTKLYSFEHH